MNLSEFYAALLPDDGKLIIAKMCDGEKNGKTFKYFQHVVCDDHAQARQATAQLAKSGADVYYALGSYKQGFHPKPKDPTKQQVRVRDNVHKIKALWFDIDFKGGLSNPTEVVAALREFCNRARMPAPSILTHSGNGIHAYWPLTTAISYSRWQPLADAFKRAAQDHSLAADLVCTGDPARVLRPIGTRNFKDPANPKPVVPLFSSGKLFTPDELEDALLGSGGEDGIHGAVPAYLRGHVADDVNEGLVGGLVGARRVESFIPIIAKKCGVLGHILTVNGEDSSEPEWTAALQLAKHCADGEIYYHSLSEGHSDYTPEDTNEKWQQRLENDAGPTVCDTFAAYRPEVCKACPHRGQIKTPLSLGEEEVVTATGKEFPLKTWRPVEGHMGMERKMFDKANNQYLWEKVLSRSWELDSASSDIVSGAYTLTVTSRLGKARPVTVDLSGRLLGDTNTLKKELGENGCPIKQAEVTHWIALMTTWLEQIQQKRNVGRSVARLGWVEQRQDDDSTEVLGFTAGDTSFLKNGDVEENLRISTEYREIARHFLPTGNIEVWNEAANFIADQNNPAFTAILASAFATPLFGFTGMPGAMLTLVSSASGVGKSSVMRTAQAVWGSPTRGMNSTSDTYLSIIRKAAFLKNLPIYWDEIRGEHALEAFYKTAFDIAQGKERTRLNTNAEMREINDWKTMVIGASNESIFDFMGQAGGQSDAATARTFEIEIEPFADPTRASRNSMFGLLDNNYGRAGNIYSGFIAKHQVAIAASVRSAYEHLYKDWGFHEGERFWCAIVASLLVGAGCAKKAGIVNIDTETLKTYLRNRVGVLRERTGQVMAGSSAREVVIAYLQAHQDGQLLVDKFPSPGDTTEPLIHSVPKSKLMIVRCDNTYRFMKQDFTKWLRTAMHMTFSSLEKQMIKELHLDIKSTILANGTKWRLPKARVIEVTLGD